MDEQQVRQIIKEELSGLFGSDRYTFQRKLQIFDGRNIQLGLGTGTKIGTSALQKLGFWNATPVVQSQGIGASGYGAIGGTNVNSNDNFTGGVGSNTYTIGDLVRALKLAGFILS